MDPTAKAPVDVLMTKTRLDVKSAMDTAKKTSSQLFFGQVYYINVILI